MTIWGIQRENVAPALVTVFLAGVVVGEILVIVLMGVITPVSPPASLIPSPVLVMVTDAGADGD